MPDRRLFRLLVLVPALLLHGFSSAAQDGAGEKEPIAISIEITGPDEVENPGLSDLFLETLQLELRLAQLHLSGSDDPDVLIRGRYTVSGDYISFSLSAELPAEGRRLFSVTSTEELRFALDTILLEHARRLVASVEEYRRANRELYAAEAEEALPDASQEAPGTLSPQPSGGFVFGAEGGIFLAAGEAGRYLGSACVAGLFAGYRILPAVAAGLSLGGMLFRVEGYETQAAGYVVLAGPSLRLKGGSSGLFVPGLRAEAGAALFSVSPEESAEVRRILPYAETGMTTDLTIGGLAFQAAVELTLFFDGGALLYGFTPRLGLEF